MHDRFFNWNIKDMPAIKWTQRTHCFVSGFIGLLFFAGIMPISAQTGLVQIKEGFDKDPGWKGYQNRISPIDPPTITQDFGWSLGNHMGALGGEVGGRFQRSLTIAYYAMPLGRPLTFNDRVSAEGTVALMPREKQGGAYIGFFNHLRQDWRPWNSIAWRIGDYPRDGEIHVDYMAANWMANGIRLPELLPGDGKPYKWKLVYDPEARVNPTAESDALIKMLPDIPTAQSGILQIIREHNPLLTEVELDKQLWLSQRQGLVGFKNMGNDLFWWKNPEPESLHGRITFQLEDGREYAIYLPEEHHQAPAIFDRFGVFNFQLYGRHWEFYDNESTGTESELYIGNLVINGETVELEQDPCWEGAGNHMTFTDADFHGRHDYGYTQTNWAGGDSPGEAGGTIWRNEAIDPLHSFYADPVGGLTLEDPIRFSGKLAFVSAGTDGDAIVGYFNEKERMREFTGGNRIYPPDLAEQLGGRNKIHLGFDQRGSRIPGSMGFIIGGPTRVGFYFSLFCIPTENTASMVSGPVIMPDGNLHHFSFDYQPGVSPAGRINASLDEKTFSLDLTLEQRQANATFDLFGLTMPRQGGKWAIIYIDDIEYTAREDRDMTHYQQAVTSVKYPRGGRFY